MTKISELISNKEAQDILKYGDRKQMVLDAEAEIKTRIKEPWEMTQGEYLTWYDKTWTKEGIPGVKADWRWASDNHKFLVEQALSEGKSVPKKVLAEYPDLKEKVEADEEKEKKK